MIRTLSIALAAACLATACATPVPQTAWKPRPDANLGADQAACVTEANGTNMRSAEGYAAAHTGVAAAAADLLDKEDLRGGAEQRLFVALRDGCMMRKGWTKAG